MKDQVTIPKPLRDHLRLAPGDHLEFEILPDGRAQIRKAEAESGPPPDRFARLVGRASAGLTRTFSSARTPRSPGCAC
ncbi:AbrB/MazE/SpoVT family DNA-binding domain-containing protein [Craurococcus roseus]|uniref:AbrB/MazE/SpoVT family DNA-binding domain-containing protein n=1 Tax=Craurococcus roseus TaxID=77585 RepID=UPI0038D1FD86